MANPYKIQREIPIQKKINIPVEMSLAERLLYILKTCGSRASDVRAPAM